MERNNGTLDAFENGTSVFLDRDARAEKDPLGVTDQAVTTEAIVSNATATDVSTTSNPMTDALGVFKPMKVLFLSADTGGGHRASAQSLMHQVRLSLELRFLCCFYRLCGSWFWAIISQSNIVPFFIYTFKIKKYHINSLKNITLEQRLKSLTFGHLQTIGRCVHWKNRTNTYLQIHSIGKYCTI
jgi:hypothetical protein